MNLIAVRNERINDFDDIYNVHFNAFGRTNEAELVKALHKKIEYDYRLSFVMCKESELIGHVLFTAVNIISEHKLTPSLAMAPVSILPQYQNKKYGSVLIETALDELRFFGFGSVIVLGHKNYYPRFGFQKAQNWNIKAPFPVKAESFMALELWQDTLADAGGIVEYPNEFYAF